MKARTQLLTLVSMATLALGGVTVASGLLLNTPENNSINAADQLAKPQEGILVGGNTVYFSIPNSTDTDRWQNGGAKTAVRYYNNTTQQEAWTDYATAIKTLDNDRTLYEATIPTAAETYDFLIITRQNPVGSINWNNSWGQSNDIYSSQIKGNCAIIPDTLSYNGNKCIDLWSDDHWTTINHYERINIWANSTNLLGTNSVCDPANTTEAYRNDIKSKWEAAKESFSKLGYDVRAYFSNLDSSGSYEGEEEICRDTAARYDHIATVYDLEDWACRLG